MMGSIIRGSALTVVGMAAASVLEYVYFLYAANKLPAAQFGLLSASVSVLTILLALGTAGIGTTLTRFVADSKRTLPQSVYVTSGLVLELVVSLVLAVALALVALILLPESRFADLGRPLLVVAAIFPLTSIAVVLPMIFLGLSRIVLYNGTVLVYTAARVAALVPLVALGFGVEGALAAFLVGGLATLLFCWPWVRELLHRDGLDLTTLRTLVRFSLPVTATTFLVALFVRADVVLLKLLSTGEVNVVVGQYTAPAVLARGIFYLASAVPLMMLPAVASADRIPFATLGRLIVMLSGLFALAWILAYWLASPLVDLLFPPGLQSFSYLLPHLVLAMSLLTLASLLANVLIAARRPTSSTIALSTGFGIFVLVALLLVPGRRLPEPLSWELPALGPEGIVIGLVLGCAVALLLQVPPLLRLRSEARAGLGLTPLPPSEKDAA